MNMNTFPLTFQQHLIFCIVAVLFLVLQFVRQRYWYQLVIAGAIAGSLLIYVNENTGWFYSVGVAELLLMLVAIVLYVVQSKIIAKAEAQEDTSAETVDEDDAEATSEATEETAATASAEEMPAEEDV